jgi:hypothetical protein
VFGIFTSRAMRERGRYQLQLMKTRNSSGVGQKIDLGFNLDTLRIEDLGEEDEQTTTGSQTGSSLLNNLKRGGGTTTPVDTVSENPSEGGNVGKIKAETNSTQLRNFLNNLGD